MCVGVVYSGQVVRLNGVLYCVTLGVHVYILGVCASAAGWDHVLFVNTFKIGTLWHTCIFGMALQKH